MRFILAAFQLFIGTLLLGQSYSVEGTISDTTGVELEGASVILLVASDSTLAGFSITNREGRFKISNAKAGEYFLEVTFLGFDDFHQSMKLQGEERKIVLDDIVLTQGNMNLDEIMVKADHIPIKIKKDTIEYNALAFKTAPNAVVEDLLKKLPGVEVEKDGTIKAQGKEVDRVLVEGKEFFGDDPQIATKNLAANAVDKVQIFDKKSDTEEFTGIDDGEESQTINIALKEGMKQGFFGKGGIGYGTDNRYQANFNVNTFRDKTQMTAIGMANNVNLQGFSLSEYLSFMGGLGNLSGGGGGFRISSDGGIPIDFGSQNTGNTKTWGSGLNLSHEFSKKTELSFNYFYSNIERFIFQTSTKENILADERFDEIEESSSTSEMRQHTANFVLRSKIDSTQRIRISGNIGWANGGSTNFLDSKIFNTSEQLNNTSLNNNLSNQERLNYGLNINYNLKLGDKSRILSAKGRLSNRINDIDNFLNAINGVNLSNAGLMTIDTLLQNQLTEDNQLGYNLELQYTEPLGKRRYLYFTLTRSNSNSEYNKDFYDVLVRPNHQEVLNDFLSNAFNRDFSFNTAKISFQMNRSKSMLQVGAALQQSILKGELKTLDQQITKEYNRILPTLRYNYDFNGSTSMTVNYRTNVSEPSLIQLQPIIDNSDPLNIYIGNPDLNAAYRHTASIHFNHFSQFSGIGLFGNIRLNYVDAPIITSQSINSSFVRTATPINADYSQGINAFVSFNAPLKFLDMKMRWNNNFSINNNPIFVNDFEDRSSYRNLTSTLVLDNRKKEIVDWSIGTSLSLNRTKYDLNEELSQSFSDISFFANVEIDFKKGWYFETSADLNTYSQESFGSNNQYTLINASISKSFLKDQKGQLKLSAVDLLNQESGINRTSNLNYLSETISNTLGRYFIISFHYSFSGFANKQVEAINFSRSRR